MAVFRRLAAFALLAFTASCNAKDRCRASSYPTPAEYGTTTTVPSYSHEPYPGPTDPACEEGLTTCGGLCVNILKDPENCGSCNSNCPTGICIKGACPADPGCGDGLTLCGDQCVNVLKDPQNCGSCNSNCLAGTCINGACPVDGCFGQTCDTFTACGPGGTCVCASITGNVGFCADRGTPCSGLVDCGTSADCPAGSVCAVGTCCTRNVCISADQCSVANPPSRLFLPRAVSNATIGHRGSDIDA